MHLLSDYRSVGIDHMARLIGISRPLSAAPHINDPKHWRERAEETRVIAEQMQDVIARGMMMNVAQDYERLARCAAERLAAEYGRAS